MTPTQTILAIYVFLSICQFACLLKLVADNDWLKDQNRRLKDLLRNRQNYPKHLFDNPGEPE